MCVAVFPTTSDASVASRSEQNIGIVHMISAGVLFTLLAIFALFLFPRTSGEMTPAKQRRKLLYRICGVVMAVAILSMFPSQKAPDSWHLFRWLETLGVIAFGVSWLINGGLLGILADKNPTAVPSGATA